MFIFKKFDFAIRLMTLVLTLTIGLFFLFFGAKTVLAANLKPSNTISSSVLTLGDVFDGVDSHKAEHILGPAPQPGQHMTLNAQTLNRVAVVMDLPWRATSTNDQITIRRAATVIDKDLIIETVRNGLKEKGIDGKFKLSLYTQNPQIILSPNLPQSLELETISYSPSNDFFEAKLYAPSKEHAVSELTLTGKVERLIEVPVLNRTIRTGEVISKNDIDWVDMTDRDVQHDILLNTDDLIGMTPRRMVMSGKVIRDRDVELPNVIKRGDNIVIMFEMGSMSLTAEGRALEDGAKDDLIRVVNTTTSRPLDAIVLGDGTVSVSQ